MRSMLALQQLSLGDERRPRVLVVGCRDSRLPDLLALQTGQVVELLIPDSTVLNSPRLRVFSMRPSRVEVAASALEAISAMGTKKESKRKLAGNAGHDAIRCRSTGPHSRDAVGDG